MENVEKVCEMRCTCGIKFGGSVAFGDSVQVCELPEIFDHFTVEKEGKKRYVRTGFGAPKDEYSLKTANHLKNTVRRRNLQADACLACARRIWQRTWSRAFVPPHKQT